MSDARELLEKAWAWRERDGLITEAARVFHGPTEGEGTLREVSVDLFARHAWITLWSEEARSALGSITAFLKQKGVDSAVSLYRPEQGIPEEPRIEFGAPSEGRFTVHEGAIQVGIQLLGARHPGLFLDHAPLRRWLEKNAHGWRVLNTFAYTGSLSLSARAGGATHVTTLDLSRPTIEWARENWKLNGFPDEEAHGRFIYGDVFEWIPRLIKGGARYDCVILDPPSFSRGKKGSFSTAKDLVNLHELAFRALADEGTLITSINSANVPRAKYRAEVEEAASAAGFELEMLREIELPPTFPAKSERDRYLKGWIFRAKKGLAPSASTQRVGGSKPK